MVAVALEHIVFWFAVVIVVVAAAAVDVVAAPDAGSGGCNCRYFDAGVVVAVAVAVAVVVAAPTCVAFHDAVVCHVFVLLCVARFALVAVSITACLTRLCNTAHLSRAAV